MEEEAIEPLLDRLDGICLSGGPDLDPASYGADPHDELGPTEPDLDRFELAIARRADVRQMPILAICRGTQALNVVRGGVLHQHLPELSEEILHRQKTPGSEPSHAVEVGAAGKADPVEPVEQRLDRLLLHRRDHHRQRAGLLEATQVGEAECHLADARLSLRDLVDPLRRAHLGSRDSDQRPHMQRS
jgi:hypothetical protein